MKYHVMLLCKTGTMSILSPLRWVDDWHIVRMCAFDTQEEAEHYRRDLLHSWVTEEPYDRNLPEHIQSYIAEKGLHLV